jgi:hypothetical protein
LIFESKTAICFPKGQKHHHVLTVHHRVLQILDDVFKNLHRVFKIPDDVLLILHHALPVHDELQVS